MKNNYNTHMAIYFRKLKQSGNDIWSVNKIQREKYLDTDLFLKFKKALFRVKANGLYNISDR